MSGGLALNISVRQLPAGKGMLLPYEVGYLLQPSIIMLFQVIGSGMGFYQEFFTNLQEGLTKERVQNSPSECSAVITAFMECLKFCLLHKYGDGSNMEIQEYLIKEQVLNFRSLSTESRSASHQKQGLS